MTHDPAVFLSKQIMSIGSNPFIFSFFITLHHRVPSASVCDSGSIFPLPPPGQSLKIEDDLLPIQPVKFSTRLARSKGLFLIYASE